MFDIEDTAVLVLAALLTRADRAGHTGPTGGGGEGVSPRPHPPPSEHKTTCLNPLSTPPPPHHHLKLHFLPPRPSLSSPCRSPSSPCAQLRAEAAVDRGASTWSGAGRPSSLPPRPPLIFHCHLAGEEQIKTNMWRQGVPPHDGSL